MVSSFEELKTIIETCKQEAIVEHHNYVFVEEIILKFLQTHKIPDVIKSMYEKNIELFKKKLIDIIKFRKENETKVSDTVIFHPDVENFLEIFKTLELVTAYDVTDANMYCLMLLAIPESSCQTLKIIFDSCGLDNKFLSLVQQHLETMDLLNSTSLLDMFSDLGNAFKNINKIDDENGNSSIPPITLTGSYQIHPINMGITTNEESSELKDYCIDVCELVKDKNWTKLIGREQEIEEIQQILLRKDKPNLILIGEPGIGKTKLVQGFASAINKKKVHPFFEKYKVYELNLLELISGTSLRGQFEERLNNIIKEIKKLGNVILYIDEIHMIRNDNNSNADRMDIASILKPLLTSGTIRVIGSTTNEEYMASFSKDKALQRRFQNIYLSEPSIDETAKILKGIKVKYESFHNVFYSAKIINLIINLADKYMIDKNFPDKAIELLDTIGAYCNFKKNEKNEKNTLTKYKISDNDVFNVISEILKMPITQLTTSEQEKLKSLKDEMMKVVIGQEKAIDGIINGVMISKAGLRERNKTALTLFFKGATGVGKTECVKTLANVLGIPLFRYDMSEFMEEHTVSKLIGSPPGYKGYEDGRAGSGLLINQVKTNPHCIILLDEIEKANPKVLNIFLQIMDNGRLTSSSGIEADFSNAFIFMTSNVGATASHKMASIGFGVKEEENGSDVIFNESFSPEFRNRLDGSVTFNNLSNEVLNTITEKFLIELKNILEAKKVKLLYDTSVTKYISSKAEKENLGARPIKRIIHNEIKNVISKELVYGKLVNGGKLTISTKEKGLSFNFK